MTSRLARKLQVVILKGELIQLKWSNWFLWNSLKKSGKNYCELPQVPGVYEVAREDDIDQGGKRLTIGKQGNQIAPMQKAYEIGSDTSLRGLTCILKADGCIIVDRLAEHRLRRQLLATEQTVPTQINKPTNCPTMRWISHCFEGIDLLHFRMGSHWQTQVLGLQALHQQVLRLLGPVYSQFYFFSP